MAYFCPVAPLTILNGLKAWKQLGDQHLLLAHDIAKAENWKQYMDLFYTRNGYNRCIILDNSVIETGNSVDMDMIVKAAQAVQPTTVVLPDVLEDTDATIKACKAAYEPWCMALAAGLPHHRCYLMYVPQGKTIQDFARAAEAMRSEQRINFWGIPRNLVALHGTRIMAIKICKALNPQRKIHLLGFSDSMCDDVICAHSPDVYSIDSAVPLRVQEFSIGSVPEKRGAWWDNAYFDQDVVLPNLAYARQIFSGH